MEVNRNHVVRVCTGLSCRLTGAADHLRALERRLTIARGETTADGRVTLEDAPCLAVCSLAPVVEVDGVCHGRVTWAAIDRLPVWFRARPPWPMDVDASSFPPVHSVGETARERLDSLRTRAETRARTRPDLRILVQGGSCGEALGAGEMIKAVRLLAAMRGLDAEVLDGGCHGMCWAGILVEIQRTGWPRLTFMHLTTDDVPDLLSAVTSDGSPSARFEAVAWNGEGWRGVPPAFRHPFFARQRRLIMERCGHLHPVSLDDALLSDTYSALADVLDRRVPEEVIVKASALQKALGEALECLVVNGQEGTPGLFVCRHLMEGDPYRVLEGLMIAAYAAGTNRGTIHINGAAPLSVQRMTRALAKAQSAGLVGDRVLGSTFSCHVEIECRAYPTSAAMCNVATLAALPAVIVERKDGSSDRSATRLYGVSGPVNRPGLVEVDADVTLRELLFDVAGGFRNRCHGKRVLVVGPSEVLLLSPDSFDAPMKSLPLAAAGGIIPLSDDDPVGVQGDAPTGGRR